MKFMYKDYFLSTKKQIKLVDISVQITIFVEECAVDSGMCTVK